ncbi:hypothetical protein GCM10027440_39650 [Nocardiopsis coralliicola]
MAESPARPAEPHRSALANTHVMGNSRGNAQIPSASVARTTEPDRGPVRARQQRPLARKGTDSARRRALSARGATRYATAQQHENGPPAADAAGGPKPVPVPGWRRGGPADQLEISWRSTYCRMPPLR